MTSSIAGVLATTLGIALCALLFAALTMWGLAIVVTRVAWVGYALRIAGAAYLIYLGVSLLRSRHGEAAQVVAAPGSDALHGLREGYARQRTVIDRILGSALVVLGVRLGATH
jgi:threonine efflux protein